tara:strand:- start:7133 stop:7240 length:108 start_codon:yes stop_codon:yes gene_type:complete
MLSYLTRDRTCYAVQKLDEGMGADGNKTYEEGQGD